MSATEELRELLDESGVEYTVVHGYREYIWEFGESGIARASAIGTRGLVQMIVTGITPAQAVAATLSNEREKELESLAADMFCWLVDYLTPAQTQMWETRLEELNVPPTWGVRS